MDGLFPLAALAATVPERLARARADLRLGLPVGIGGSVAMAAETLGDARLAALRGMGDPVLAVTARRAETLKARAYDGDLARVRLPADVDAAWVHAVADPAFDLRAPLKGPLVTLRGGTAAEARAAVALVKSARLLPAAVLVPGPLPDALERLDVADIHDETLGLGEIISARLPLEVSEAGRIHVFRPTDGGDEHYAIEIGSPARDRPVLARLHSACFTGDLLGSLKCDCGPQLRAAMAAMGAEGAGVLLYLNQEGRGIGLANKMRAYALQDQGFDTVEANHRLGFEDDERDFRIGARMLQDLGFGAVRLMTNNPAKVAMLGACGIEVAERVPLKVGQTRFNSHYLATKAAKSGHLL